MYRRRHRHRLARSACVAGRRRRAHTRTPWPWPRSCSACLGRAPRARARARGLHTRMAAAAQLARASQIRTHACTNSQKTPALLQGSEQRHRSSLCSERHRSSRERSPAGPRAARGRPSRATCGSACGERQTSHRPRPAGPMRTRTSLRALALLPSSVPAFMAAPATRDQAVLCTLFTGRPTGKPAGKPVACRGAPWPAAWTPAAKPPPPSCRRGVVGQP